MKNLIVLLVCILTALFGQAQTMQITGNVSDLSGPLPGANVIVKGSAKGTQTDFDGNYKIVAKKRDTLVFSYLGYKTEYMEVKDSSIVNIILLEDAATLDEVVVMGYGIERHSKSLSYSISTVESADITRGLAGKASGISISKEIGSGLLTAAEINDLNKWKSWNKALKTKEAVQVQHDWSFNLRDKVSVVIKDDVGNPVNNVLVSLYDNNDESNKPIMQARTDVFGNAVFFRGLSSKDKSKDFIVQAFHNGSYHGKKINSAHDKVDFVMANTNISNNIDVMFTIDATGSMGDEMDYLKSELKNIMIRLDESINKKRVALTFYRDTGDEYVVKDFDFNTNIDFVKDILASQKADGGGDYEEAVEKALQTSLSKSWDVNAKSKLLFLLLDAPPHLTKKNVSIIKKQIQIAQEKGIKIIPIVASDADKTVEFLMRFFSISTNGTYVFLTDDSGIGNDHLEPTTSDYKVEKLNDLIVRLIEKYSGIPS